MSASTSTADTSILAGILKDPEYFTDEHDWSLLGFLLYRQQCKDFLPNKSEEHHRYSLNLTKLTSYEETPVHLLRRASRAIGLMQTEKKSKLVDEFWKNATSVQRRKVEAITEREALLEEHVTNAVYSTSRQGRIVQEKLTRRLEDTDLGLQKLQTQSLVISSEEYIERSQEARSIIARGPLLNADTQRKRPAEEASPTITPPPSYNSEHISLNDYNEESTEVEDVSTEASPTNDQTREEYEEDENYGDDTEEEDENRMTQEKKEQFRKIFQGIPTEAKLVLNSKTVVEDVLFEYAKDLDYESHAHSFIICDHDDKIKSLFSKEDWKELTKKPSLPSVDYEIGKELAKYMKEDLAQLRQEVMRNFLKEDEVYDPKEHYFKEWIQITLRHLCNLYENPSAPLCREQYEDWFTVNLFGNCFDFLMRHPKMSTDIKRTDAPSTASANRKNRARKPKQRKLTGRKIDGIIHHPTYNIELGALEAARSFVNDGDRKLLIESFKMPKTLKDILVDMIRSKRCSDEEVNKLVAIGVLHFRYNIQFVRLWLAGGSICIFSKDDIHSISDHFSKMSHLDFLKFLKAIVRSQIIIENNLKALGFIEKKTPKKDDFNEEDLISNILGNDQDPSRPTTPENKIYSIVDCFETPHKRKISQIKTPRKMTGKKRRTK